MKGYFDGASRGNPGEAGAGALLMDDDGNIVWETASFLGKKTNNEAEYRAAILLLKAARERGVKELLMRGDSKLVVSQLSREWKINLPHLRELAAEAWRAAEGMNVKYEWIPRAENKRADRLSNEAIDNAK
ncbi:MAG: ribonuclease HI family protein [Synergistaceae bacterium]|nr:ribonuclease HI family protein [Synergistaceae bacterium]